MTERDTSSGEAAGRFLPMIQPPSNSTLRRYGLTASEWWALLESQDGKCPVCTKRFTLRRRAAIDHDHRTGAVRGLLCLPCNDALGRLHENIDWLWNAFTYLTRPPANLVFDTPRRHVDAPPA